MKEKSQINNISLHASSAVLSKKDFYQTIIHHVFSPMHLGRLNMILPDGRRIVYGQGNEVEATLYIRDNVFFKRCVLFGDVGFGESYVDGDWDTDNISKVIEWMILNVENHPTLMADEKKRKPVNFLKLLNTISFKLRPNSLQGSRKNISDHYDLSNEFFKTFLDPTLLYSSAYFKDSDKTLEEAQRDKIDHLCHKLKLRSTDHLLEIGSGWGYCAIHAAKNYGCRVKTVTISTEQYALARKRIHEEGLSDRIDIELIDYRHLKGQYDKIVSVEMIEAVGHKYYETFFNRCHELLKKDGLLALQMILSPDHRYDSFRKNVDWIQKHIFPGSLLPSLSVLQRAMNKTGQLCLYDYEDMTKHYVKTLQLWQGRFNRNLDNVLKLGFDHKFIRKWNYYMAYCEAAFYMRNISVAQAVYSRPNNLNLR